MMIRKAALLATSAFGLVLPTFVLAGTPYDGLIAQHAAANGVPVELVHRVIIRESRYNPRAVNSGNYGMMQIRLQTARGLGYRGTAQGLLDPNTNLTYAVKYLAGAYRVAHGNQSRAVALYASGYYYAAKRQGLSVQSATVMPIPTTFAAPALEPAVLRGNAGDVMSASGAPPFALSAPAQVSTAARAHRLTKVKPITTGVHSAKDNAKPVLRRSRAASM